MIRMTGFTAAPVLAHSPAVQNLSWTPSRVDWANLNAQPLPAKDVFSQVKAAYNSNAGFGPYAANPEAERGIIIIGGKSQVRLAHSVMPGDWVTINPQPLPPKEVFQQVKAAFNAKAEAQRGMTPGDWVTLNPQPLPPKVGFQQVANIVLR